MKVFFLISTLLFVGLTTPSVYAGNCPGASSYGLNKNQTLAQLGVTSCYYIGTVGTTGTLGSDTNSGADEQNPWLHAPFMNGCSGACLTLQNSMSGTSAAGYGFIFRGGDTWHARSGQSPSVTSWNWNTGGTPNGTSTHPIYIGIDPSWPSTGWGRPIINGDNPTLASQVGCSGVSCVNQFVNSCAYNYPAGGTFLTLSNRQYYIVDNFEFTGFCTSWASDPSDGEYILINTNSASKMTYLNLYVHGWSRSVQTKDASNHDKSSMWVFRGGNGGGATAPFDTVKYLVIDGRDSDPRAMGTAYGGGNTFYDVSSSYMGYAAQAIVSPHVFHDNLQEYYYDQGHGNMLESVGDVGTSVYYNNVWRYVDQVNANEVGVWALPSGSNTAYFFNNVYYQPGGSQQMNIGNGASSTGHYTFFNNTFENTANNSIMNCQYLLTSSYGANNVFIADGGAYNRSAPDRCPTYLFPNEVTERSWTHAQATTYTDSSSYTYYPRSNSPTIGAGTNETNNFCSQLATAAASDATLTDASTSCGYDTRYGVSYDSVNHVVTGSGRTPVSRGSTWDQGAYQYTGPFPLKVNGRYLTDQQNNPFLIVGDAPQSLFAKKSTTASHNYFVDRASKGFNALWVHLLEASPYFNDYADARDFDGNHPFTSPANPASNATYVLSSENINYFNRVEQVINDAAAQGLVVFLDPIETQTWLATLNNSANGSTQAARELSAYNYGVYLGQKFNASTHPNIVWFNGNDFQSWRTQSDSNLVKEVMRGINDGATAANALPQTILLDYNESYSHQNTTTLPYTTLDSAYTYYDTYNDVLNAYNASPTMPVYLAETNYEFEDNVNGGFCSGKPNCTNMPVMRRVLREVAYWTMTSGGAGYIYGNHYTWPATWNDANFSDPTAPIDTVGVTQLGYWKSLFNSFDWWTLVPDQTNALVTAASRGTKRTTSVDLQNSTYATAAMNAAKTKMLVYTPCSSCSGGANNLNVYLSQFASGHNVTAQWFDPGNGTYATIGTYAATGSRSFATPGTNSDGGSDWVLVLTDAGINTYSISGTISNASGTISVNSSPYVTVNLTGASSASTSADSSGNYSFSGLANGSYTITPSKSGYTFSPSSSPQTVSGANITSVNFSATGTPVVSLDHTSLAFGSVTIGQTLNSAVVLSNTGTAALSFSTSMEKTGEFSIYSNTCSPSGLAAATSCTITIRFTPTSTGCSAYPCSKSGTLYLYDTGAAGSPHTVSLSGSAITSFQYVLGNPNGTGSFTWGVPPTPAPSATYTAWIEPRNASTHNFAVPGGNCTAGGSCGTVIDYPSPLPTVSNPGSFIYGKGVVFTDTSFNGAAGCPSGHCAHRYIRVTDATTTDVSMQYATSDAAGAVTANADNTVLLLKTYAGNNSGKVFQQFDPVNFQVGPTPVLNPGYTDVTFDPADKTIFYVYSGTTNRVLQGTLHTTSPDGNLGTGTLSFTIDTATPLADFLAPSSNCLPGTVGSWNSIFRFSGDGSTISLAVAPGQDVKNDTSPTWIVSYTKGKGYRCLNINPQSGNPYVVGTWGVGTPGPTSLINGADGSAYTKRMTLHSQVQTQSPDWLDWETNYCIVPGIGLCGGPQFWQISTLTVYSCNEIYANCSSGHDVKGVNGMIHDHSNNYTPYADMASTYSMTPYMFPDEHLSWWNNKGADQEPWSLGTTTCGNNYDWVAAHGYALNYSIQPTSTLNPHHRNFKVITAGTSGAVASEPNWDAVPVGGTVTDNGVVWQNTPTSLASCAPQLPPALNYASTPELKSGIVTPFTFEIDLAYPTTDASGDILRFGHNFTSYNSGRFDAQYAITNLDKNGCYVQFGTDLLGMAGTSAAILPPSSNGATESGTTVTISTVGPHQFNVGNRVIVQNVNVAGYNGTWTITAVPDDHHFSYTATSSGLGNSGSGGAAVDKLCDASMPSHVCRTEVVLMDLCHTYEDLADWMMMTNRSAQHMDGTNGESSWKDADGQKLWHVKSGTNGYPWDIRTYDSSRINWWITENTWSDASSYKRYLTPVPLVPRYLTPGTSFDTGELLAPNYIKTNVGGGLAHCGTETAQTDIGHIKGITSGPFSDINFGGNVGQIPYVKVQYRWGGTNGSATYNKEETYYYAKPYGLVRWTTGDWNGSSYPVLQTSNFTTLSSGGSPTPSFTCSGQSWWIGGTPGSGGNAP